MKKVFLILTLSISLLSNATEKDSLTVNNFQKTDEVLSEIVKKALVVAEKTGDFVIEQTPLLLQEFYAWNIWSNIFWIVFAIILILIFRYIPNFWLGKEKTSRYDSVFFNRYGDDGAIFAWVLFLLVSIFSLILIFVAVHDLIYILVAPKLYLIDYFLK